MPTGRAKRRNASYIPLRIAARLRCGVISDGLLPFDALLYYALHREARPGGRVMALSRQSATRMGEDDPDLLLPLKRLNGDRPEWYHAASCAVWPAQIAEGTNHWTKRVDAQYADLVTTTAKIPISGGRYKAYRMPVAYRHALQVTWYARGEPTRIRQLLQLVTHIGKKTEMGWGAVIDWTVEPHDQDWSVTGPDGALMRPIPDASGVLYGLRPPYWHPRNQAQCRIPSVAISRLEPGDQEPS